MTDESMNQQTNEALKEKYTPLTNLILNEPLIEHKPTLEGLDLETLESAGQGSIYYGTGLTLLSAIALSAVCKASSQSPLSTARSISAEACT